MNVARYSCGLTLLEVLLAIFILTSTLLLSMLVLARQNLRVEKITQQAVALHVLDMFVFRVRHAHGAVARGRVMAQWRGYARELLPQGSGDVLCQQTCRVCVQWVFQRKQQRCVRVPALL